MTAIAIAQPHLDAVRAILREHLPGEIKAAVFGSRAGGQPKPWSDLDLVLNGAGPLPLSLMATLTEAFDDSSLPWKVDIVDRSLVDEAFGRLIDETAAPIAI